MNIVDVCGTVVAVVVVRREDRAVTCSTVVTDTAWVSTVGVVLMVLLLSAWIVGISVSKQKVIVTASCGGVVPLSISLSLSLPDGDVAADDKFYKKINPH